MTKIAMVFPGQGSQKVGMGADFYEKFDIVKNLFHQADDILGYSISQICFEGPQEELLKTQNTQMGIFLVSAGIFSVLKANGIIPNIVAGHSLGEITAYWVAGVLDTKTALEVIQKRGTFMAESYPAEDSAMTAIIGASEEIINKALSQVDEKETAVIANYNSPEQTVISGTKTGIQQAITNLKKLGVKRIIPLKVSGAFHSPLMEKASDNFNTYLQNINFQNASIPIVLNRLAKPETNAQKLKENLGLQIKSWVKWVQTLKYIAEQKISFIECGPGKVLSGLITKTLPEAQILTVNNIKSLEEILKGELVACS